MKLWLTQDRITNQRRCSCSFPESALSSYSPERHFKKRKTGVSSKACFPQLDAGDHQVLEAGCPSRILCGKSCPASGGKEAAGRMCPGALPRGSSAWSHRAGSPTSTGDGAGIRCSRAVNPYHEGRAERQGWVRLDQIVQAGRRRQKTPCDATFLQCAIKETFFRFSPSRLISCLGVK